MVSFKKYFLFACLLSLLHTVSAQSPRGNDTTYYQYFPGSITARLYASQKYTAFTMKQKGADKLTFLPNTSFNVGVGATYHNFSLNLAYGWPFLNRDADKGKSKYLDLQGHIYKPHWVADVYGQLYEGYHFEPDHFALPQQEKYYQQPNARVNLFGAAVYHVYNGDRFSYRAALIQNEWQKKSAGSLLAGAEAYYATIKNDSSWIPAGLPEYDALRNLRKVNYASFGPGVGYAYTLVAMQHLFLTGSLTANLNISFTQEQSATETQKRFSVQSATRFRIAAGYNGSVWNISANWIADDLPFKSSHAQHSYALQTGNYRIIVAKRFMPGPRLQRKLRLADKIFKE